MRLLLGDKFYKYDKEQDKITLLRIRKMKNENNLVTINETDNKEVRITKDELLKDYIKLKPDGYMAFSIVNLDAKAKDIIVALFRKQEIENGDNTPYCVCRQNIFDLFTNQIQKNLIKYVGVSISKDTIPEDTPYEIALACNGVDRMIMLSYYIGDVLDSLLEMIKTSKFDAVLGSMYTSVKDNNVRGYCKNLRELLEQNDFMYDVLKGYNINRVPFKIKTVNDYELASDQRTFIEDLIKQEMFKTYVIKYDKEIDLKKIERSHVLISDLKNNIYIIAYDKGKYINRTYRNNIKNKQDAIAMLKYKKNNN